MRRIAAEAQVRAAQANLLTLDLEDADLSDGLPIEDAAEAIVRIEELDYWARKLGVAEGQ